MFNRTRRCSQMKQIAVLMLLLAFSACEAEREETIFFDSSEAVETVYAERESIAAHELPILKTMPENDQTPTRPDTGIEIYLDKSAKTFARFRSQFEKGSFTITLNGESMVSAYDIDRAVIYVNHDMLERYTTYNIQLLVKALMKSPRTKSDNASYSFGFTTGSALHEATHLEATVEKSPVKVTETGQVHVSVKDDYGLPATNATVTVTKTSSPTLEWDDLVLNASKSGEGIVPLGDRQAETVDFTITSQDNVYKDPIDTQNVELSIQFIADTAPGIHFDTFPKIALINTQNVIAGKVYDENGNPIEDGILNVACSAGSILVSDSLDIATDNERLMPLYTKSAALPPVIPSPTPIPIIEGIFKFIFKSPDNEQDVDLNFDANGNAVDKTLKSVTSDEIEEYILSKRNDMCDATGIANFCKKYEKNRDNYFIALWYAFINRGLTYSERVGIYESFMQGNLPDEEVLQSFYELLGAGKTLPPAGETREEREAVAEQLSLENKMFRTMYGEISNHDEIIPDYMDLEIYAIADCLTNMVEGHHNGATDYADAIKNLDYTNPAYVAPNQWNDKNTYMNGIFLKPLEEAINETWDEQGQRNVKAALNAYATAWKMARNLPYSNSSFPRYSELPEGFYFFADDKSSCSGSTNWSIDRELKDPPLDFKEGMFCFRSTE